MDNLTEVDEVLDPSSGTGPGTDPEIPEVPEEEEELSEQDLKDAIKDILRQVEDNESNYREYQLKLLKKLDLFWHGIQRLYWDESKQDFGSVADLNDPEFSEELEGLDEVVNIYRAHGESIIAALSTGIPSVRFFPEDADKAVDVIAAKGYSKIAELLHKRLKAPTLFVKALFTLWNQHFVAAYHYSLQDRKFGTFEEVTYDVVQQPAIKSVCPSCDYEIQGEIQVCPDCTSSMIPVQTTVDVKVPKKEIVAKSSQVVEIHGPMNVLIQNNARKVDDTGILVLYTENDTARILATYPELLDKLPTNVDDESNAQVRATHNSFFTEDTATVKQIWLRPWMFWRLGSSKRDIVQKIQAQYPSGVYAVSINDEIVDIHEEDLDEHWTISESPISRTIMADPIGQALVSLQETTNDLYSLSKETVRQGIPETFYDSNLLDADKYNQVRARPGLLFPVQRPAGQSIQDSFYQLKSATLSKEVDVFRSRIDTDAQFVTGAFPSIYGGPNEGSSGTLGEYSLSKNMALQRLQIHWKTLIAWWTELVTKTSIDFAKNMETDENFVKKAGNSFMNVSIKRAELEAGRIGQVEPEVSEQLPISWAQKKDLVTQILQLNNDMLNSVLYHPENASFIAALLGVPELYIPGDEDRTKQLIEISLLLNAQSPDGQNPSIPPEPDIDNSPVHIEVIRAWANSDAGLEAKQNNPNGYQNVLLHLRATLATLPPPAPAPEEKGKVPPEKIAKTPENTPEPKPVQ